MEDDISAPSTASEWACPRCRADLPLTQPASHDVRFALTLETRPVHSSASLETYDNSCENCGLPYTASSASHFEYPYRQLLAKVDLRRFLRWSSAQNNGYVSYSLMKGSSCSVDGREDAIQFANFIRKNVSSTPNVVVDLGCGPLPQPAYLPPLPGATLIGVDPFDSQWNGRFIQGVGEFLPLKSDSVDLVVAATALDHTLDLKLTLSELARVTKKGADLMVWDHTFEPRAARITRMLYGLLLFRVPLRTKIAQVRTSLLPERMRIYDNGIVLWTPKGYADPFHEPQSRRPSWPRKLRKAIEEAGFTYAAGDPALGLSHFMRK